MLPAKRAAADAEAGARGRLLVPGDTSVPRWRRSSREAMAMCTARQREQHAVASTDVDGAVPSLTTLTAASNGNASPPYSCPVPG